MSRILQKKLDASQIYELVVDALRIARKAQAGQFVVVMADERRERVPLTIADFDRFQGTVTMVLMVVGASSLKLSRRDEGDELHALIGPLGTASEIEPFDTVVVVAGGVGAAPVYPIARAFREAGSRVIAIQGPARKSFCSGPNAWLPSAITTSSRPTTVALDARAWSLIRFRNCCATMRAGISSMSTPSVLR